MGPEGGELRTAPCTVSVPPEAVTMETEITCQVINPNDVTLPLKDGEMLVSDIIELGPHGTTFHQPVTVQMQYNNKSSSGATEVVVWVTDDRTQWMKLETTKENGNRVAVSVDHSFIFAVVSQLEQDSFTASTKESTITSSTQPALPTTSPYSRKMGPEGGELRTTPCTVSVPPGAVTMETEITCQVINPNDVTLPLKDGEMLVSDIIELGPHGTTFHQPVTVQMQYNNKSSSGATEVVWVTEDRSQWTELETSKNGEDRVAVSVDHFSIFAVISRPKQDQFRVPIGGFTLTSSTQPAVQISFPEQAVNTETRVTVQVQEIRKEAVEELKAQDESFRSVVSTSPIVRVEIVSDDADSEVQFHKPVTVRVPHPQHYMNIQHEGPTKLRVMSCEEGTEDWMEVTGDSIKEVTEEVVEFEVTHFSSLIVILVKDDLGNTEPLGPILLQQVCQWLQQLPVQFILLQREGNENEFVVECTISGSVEERRHELMGEGYKSPLPSGTVRLFEGQEVEIRISGNVAPFGMENNRKQQITFHSQNYNRLHMQVMALKDVQQNSLDGKGYVEFHALPRVEVEKHKLESEITRLKRSARVEKYFYFIKEKVSTDWKNLAFHLGLPDPDIGNIAGKNPDDKSRCMDMLQEWKKKKGDAATIEVLMEALSEAGLQSVVDGLKKRFLDIGWF
ncbi:PREDICTED: ankyrin-3-like [Branchiostoma belcheri]|uniref:Ankyrin-3-like n=1 Tax=Branchiostoma belcheri TaxID=7741 RepID=A0A6P5A4S9_BRABE|nr:PREDICTED: ankyrin-3-like [Branchiostoma belcheri]